MNSEGKYYGGKAVKTKKLDALALRPRPLRPASDLMLDVRSKNPGDKVTLDVNRNGETKQVEVTLGSDESSQSASTQQNSAQESMLERLFGGGSGSSQQDAA